MLFVRFAVNVGHCGPTKTGVLVTVARPVTVSMAVILLEYHEESGLPIVYRYVRSGLISDAFGMAIGPRLTRRFFSVLPLSEASHLTLRRSTGFARSVNSMPRLSTEPALMKGLLVNASDGASGFVSNRSEVCLS